MILGIGKNTLAKKLFDDPLMVYHFYVRMWITISQQCRVMDLLVGLVRSVAQINSNKYQQNDEELAEKLCKSLKWKRIKAISFLWMMCGKKAGSYCKRKYLEDGPCTDEIARIEKGSSREMLGTIFSSVVVKILRFLCGSFLGYGFVAEGFVKSKTQRALEQVAEEYLQDLIDGFLIMVVKRYGNAFPLNLTKLTLSAGHLPWEDARIFGMLPNLEVHKVKRYAFQGPEWEPDEEEFCRLKTN
ncbi:hypothetical protein RND71_008767 [Anisodus tanguticus]|uniref:NB-ARC domain-containing protein n=1 Tax=Anisodus tanguticus TaxID=243964 RepID=A0AAE1SPR5_9SOLA|nr:hypothetical protein RND71_008767 [Anisodus tanguticus]